MTAENHHKNLDFSDSICSCKECNHEMGRDCLKVHCKCCNTSDHSMIMDGFEGFERKN